MDKNNKHMDAKEFFRMLDQEPDLQHADLDDFDKEALEGWKMVKDRAAAQSKVEENVNAKLEELIAADKKKKNRTGLYILSMAASLVLLFGLFFIFNNTTKDEMKVALAPSSESTGNAAKADANIENIVEETNSDAKVTDEKEPLKNLEQKPVMVPQEKMLDNEEPVTSYFSTGNGPVNLTDSGAIGKYKAVKANEGYADDIVTISENKKAQVTEVYRKEEEKVNKDADNKITGEDASGGLVNTQQEVASLKKESVKSRAVIKGKNNNTKSKTKKSEAQKPVYESNDGFVANPPAAADEQNAQPAVVDKSKTDSNRELDEVAASTAVTESTNVPESTVTYNYSNNNNVAGNNSVVANGTTTTALANTTPGSTALAWQVNKTPEVTATFKGGQKALDDYIKNNLKVPETCTSEEVIVIEFKVSTGGKVSEPKILSKTGHCKDCETEAKRFVKAMPAWIPGKTAGKDVESKTSITLSFKK